MLAKCIQRSAKLVWRWRREPVIIRHTFLEKDMSWQLLIANLPSGQHRFYGRPFLSNGVSFVMSQTRNLEVLLQRQFLNNWEKHSTIHSNSIGRTAKCVPKSENTAKHYSPISSWPDICLFISYKVYEVLRKPNGSFRIVLLILKKFTSSLRNFSELLHIC